MMIGWKVISICSLAIILLGSETGCREIMSSSSPQGEANASVVVLVDFSRGFLQIGSMTGLSDGDQSALSSVAEQLVTLASNYKVVKIVWLPIQAAGPGDVLCDPIEVTTSLVKHDGRVTSKDDIEKVMGACVSHIVALSKDPKNISNFSNISAALAMATAATKGDYRDRVLVVFSDLKEDLPSTAAVASFRFSREKVILLHRPASDEPLDVQRYLTRIDSWKERLLTSGASRVATIPLFSVSEARLRAALEPQNQQQRTSVTIVVDGNNGSPVSPFRERAADLHSLSRLGRAIAELAPVWPQPVTAQWVVAADSGYRLRSAPVVEFWQKLVKPNNLLSDTSDFANALDERAQMIPALASGLLQTDLLGTVEIVGSAEPAPQKHILILISDFERSAARSQSVHLSAGTQVLMLFNNSARAQLDPNEAERQRDEWAETLHNSSGADVCKFPLVTWTPHDLKSCLSSVESR